MAASAADRPPAPEFRLFDSDGKVRRLAEFRGKIVLLNFWATWCAPCRTEIPWLSRTQREYSDRGVVVLGVAMDARGWPAVTPFIAEYRVDYTVLLGSSAVARAYGGLRTLPQTVFIDRAGRIVARHRAVIDQHQLRTVLDLLLAETHVP